MDTNYYSSLGVPRDATEEDIKKAYRRKSLQYHPDKNTDRDTTSQFQSVARAFEVLSDPRKRVFHDI
ncbi:DnaJ domain-containing protein, partial [Bisporella sp. PMI_857]